MSAKTPPRQVDQAALRKREQVIAQARATFEIRPLDDVIREAVTHAWSATAKDAVLAAKLLGVARSTFYTYLKRYELDGWT